MAALSVDYNALAYPLRALDGSESRATDPELERLRRSKAPSYSSAKKSLLAGKDSDTQSYAAQDGELSSEISSLKSHVSRVRRRFQGWRFGVAVCASLGGGVLLTNVIFAIWGSVSRKLSEGNGDLYVGDCEVVNRQNMGIHVLINALSSLLLSASNYTMQCVSAPTRKECDKAHAKGDWLDIGVPGVRNLARISLRRRVLWALLAVSSIPIHLLYNSAIFKTIEANTPMIVLANEDYILGQNVSLEPSKELIEHFNLTSDIALRYGYNSSLAQWIQSDYLADPSTFEELSTVDCISTYGVHYLSGYSDVVLITNEPSNNTSRNVFYAGITGTNDYGWVCRSREGSNGPYCDVNVAKTRADDWTPYVTKKVDRCLARKTERNCKLQFSIHIMVVVILCNVIKTVAMLWVLLRHREKPLVTFGDAVASWLDDPDPFTTGRCLAEKPKSHISQRKWFSWPQNHDAVARSTWTQTNAGPITFIRSPIRRWRNAVSVRRWVVTLTLCIATLSGTGALFKIGIDGSVYRNVPDPLTTLGFGSINPNTMVNTALPNSDTQGFIASVLLANCPQVVLSLVYLLYNGLFTGIHLAHEYSGYGVHRKALRVTTPRGQQRSTYWLQLPFTYGIPLLIASGVLHWLCSQSLFLARVLHKGSALGEPDTVKSTVGYSCAPILCIIIIGSCMLSVTGLMGFRKLQSHMPLAGSCSAVMAAAAHRPAKDVDAALMPVKWGVVAELEGESDVGHCSFTSEEVTELQEGRMYAG